MKIVASYFDGKTSLSTEITLWLNDNGDIDVGHPDHELSYPLNKVKFSSRLGSTPRVLSLPGGSSCHIADNDLVDVFLKQCDSQTLPSIIFSLENKPVYAFISVIFTVIFSWAMITYAIPSMATAIAYNIPSDVEYNLGQGTLETLDKIIFEPSTLDIAVRDRLNQRFKQMQEDISISDQYQLIFRDGEKVGANAFALPSGIIVITDELVHISKNDNEIASVLAHEIGHLVRHHSMRIAIQGSAIAVLIATITGDPFSTSSILVALPTVLINSKYSREFEIEADDFAYRYMVSNNMDTIDFANILERITESEESGLESYISSHPETLKRVQQFKQ